MCGWRGAAKPNERMQLTWLLGAPGWPVSVHRRAVGQGGLGSPATQLMRAVSPPILTKTYCMMNVFANHYLLSLILAVLAGGAVLFHFLPPSAEWNTSPDNVVITSEHWGEVSIGDIPDVRIWGDGHMMWLQHTNQGRRQVKEAYLSREDMSRIVNTLIQSGFFVGYRWPTILPELSSYPTLYVSLQDSWHREEINQQNPSLDALVRYLQSGAGHAGTEFVPTTGVLVVIPIEDTEFRDSHFDIKYQWPEDAFGHDLASVLANQYSATITGKELAFAWDVANDPGPLVASNDRIYWLTVVIPGITL